MGRKHHNLFKYFYGFVKEDVKIIQDIKRYNIISFIFYNVHTEEGSDLEKFFSDNYKYLDKWTGKKLLFNIPLMENNRVDRLNIKQSNFQYISEELLYLFGTDGCTPVLVIANPQTPSDPYLIFTTNHETIQYQLGKLTDYSIDICGRRPFDSEIIKKHLGSHFGEYLGEHAPRPIRFKRVIQPNRSPNQKSITEILDCGFMSDSEKITTINQALGYLTKDTSFLQNRNSTTILRRLKDLEFVKYRKPRSQIYDQMQSFLSTSKKWDTFAFEKLEIATWIYHHLIDTNTTISEVSIASYVIQGICAAFEREVNSSFAHAFRQQYGITLPNFYWRYDETVGAIKIKFKNELIDLNRQRKESPSEEDWFGLDLGTLYTIIQIHIEHFQEQDSRRALEILNEIRKYRNPAQHGLPLSLNGLERLLSLIKEWNMTTMVQNMLDSSQAWKTPNKKTAHLNQFYKSNHQWKEVYDIIIQKKRMYTAEWMISHILLPQTHLSKTVQFWDENDSVHLQFTDIALSKHTDKWLQYIENSTHQSVLTQINVKVIQQHQYTHLNSQQNNRLMKQIFALLNKDTTNTFSTQLNALSLIPFIQLLHYYLGSLPVLWTIPITHTILKTTCLNAIANHYQTRQLSLHFLELFRKSYPDSFEALHPSSTFIHSIYFDRQTNINQTRLLSKFKSIGKVIMRPNSHLECLDEKCIDFLHLSSPSRVEVPNWKVHNLNIKGGRLISQLNISRESLRVVRLWEFPTNIIEDLLHYPNLEEMHLSFCSDLISLINHNQSLRSLNLSKCPNLTKIINTTIQPLNIKLKHINTHIYLDGIYKCVKFYAVIPTIETSNNASLHTVKFEAIEHPQTVKSSTFNHPQTIYFIDCKTSIQCFVKQNTNVVIHNSPHIEINYQ